MPKRKVALTKVKKKGKDGKEKMIQNIKECVNKYKYLYVLSHQNMSTNPFLKIKGDFPDSKFFVGKNKLMQFTLGRTPEEEMMPNLCLLGRNIKNECCLLFTDDENVEDYFSNFSSKDFARAGATVKAFIVIPLMKCAKIWGYDKSFYGISPKTIILPEGPEAFETYSFAMEPHFRQLGLPTKLVRQKIHLTKPIKVAEEGKPITSEHAKILKLLGHRLSEFKFKVLAKWTSSSHEVEEFDE